MNNLSNSYTSVHDWLVGDEVFNAKLEKIDRVRGVDIKSERTLMDRLWEVFYVSRGDKIGVKKLEKQYFLRRLVGLCTWGNISVSNKALLERKIKSSEIFKAKKYHIKDITVGDLKQIFLKIYRGFLKKSLDVTDHELLIYNYKTEGNAEEVIKSYKRLLSVGELDLYTQSNALMYLAKEYEVQGKVTKAIKYYEELLSGPRYLQDLIWTLSGLINIHYSLGDTLKVIEYCERLLSHPFVPVECQEPVLGALINIYRSQGNLAKVIEYSERLLSLFIVSQDVAFSTLRDLAKQYKEQGDIKKAIEYYEKLLNYPDVSVVDKKLALANLSNIHYQEENIGKSIECNLQLLELVDGDLELCAPISRLARFYQLCGDVLNSIKYCERLFVLNVSSEHKYYGQIIMIENYRLNNDVYAVIEKSKELLNNPQSRLKLNALVFLIRAYQLQGNLVETIKYCNQLLGLDGLPPKYKQWAQRMLNKLDAEDTDRAL